MKFLSLSFCIHIRVKKTKFKGNNSLEYYHVTYIGKTPPLSSRVYNGPFPSSPGLCFKISFHFIFHSKANKTHFHKKGCAPGLILKVRVFGTRKWPIRKLRG